jgi:dienelactone hydrolase
LDRWNQTDPVFAGRLNPTNAATMGWSYGGGVAAEVARVDKRCRGAIILEGYFQGAAVVQGFGLQKPSLSIYAEPITVPGSEYQLYNNPATRNAVWLQIRMTLHASFGDYYWALDPGPGAREAARTMNAYTLWFLNKHLKGRDDPMPTTSDYPRAISVRQK